ncbi:hypothetical protein GTY75_08775 [Streptomyces sp. SID8381]|uniref:hypothetical protein n=1 Tax=unclassified Streptomyces TaxID=2593676 RepID=UPI0003634F43|nr:MULTISPECIES: hypothetical protein [unclassified Streptomyces]MYX26762.1 hypothetical protein [Streptomyces sp. SID8381]
MTTTRFAYSIKALPAQPAAGAPPGPPDPAVGEVQPPAHDDSRPWAGDPYDEGDETDPAHAFAAFTGENGEEAWLDRAPDGTVTGWVRDATGQVWRYSDGSAWALDVDGAQMQRVAPGQRHPEQGSASPDGQQPPADGEEADAYADDPPAADGTAPTADPVAGADEENDPGEEDPDMEESPEEDDEDEDAPFPGARKPKKKGGK